MNVGKPVEKNRASVTLAILKSILQVSGVAVEST